MPLLLSDLATHWNQVRSQLVAHARTYTLDHSAAEDLVQECYLEAADRCDTYCGPRRTPEVRRWLIGILNNLCLRGARKRSRESALLAEVADRLSHDPPIPRGELYDAAMWVLRVADLTSRQVQVLRLRLDGHSLRQIAGRIGIDHATAAEHLQAALQAVRRCPLAILAGPSLDACQLRLHNQITVYRPPIPVGAALARESLQRLAQADARIDALVARRKRARFQEEEWLQTEER